MSLILRFLVCALIVVATSVLAAMAWDQSDTASQNPAVVRVDSGHPANR